MNTVISKQNIKQCTCICISVGLFLQLLIVVLFDLPDIIHSFRYYLSKIGLCSMRKLVKYITVI